jgi:predicted ATPase
VRIESVAVRNYRGIRRAKIDGVSISPVVTVSGPNGSGKSLLFEAIAAVWSQQWRDPTAAIGPWGEEALIELELSLTVPEFEAAVAFGEKNGMPVDTEARPRLGMRITAAHGVQTYEEAHSWRRVLRNDAFRREHRFAEIDFLPPDRTIQRGEQANVNPALLGLQQSEQFRQQVLQGYLQSRQVVQLTGIQPFLASLDYLELIADRQEIEAPGDFEMITGAFEAATGKTIARPQLDEALGAVLQVQTPAGAQHGVDELSSGEQEVLGLMYFVRRLSAQGGVLLIDEPELHLHPALQRSLFSVIEAVAERAQVWIATHSPRLVTAAPLQSIIHMRPAAAEDMNQVILASDEAARLELLDELGMHPIDLLQSEFVLILEGPADKRYVSTLLPVIVGRAATYLAGSGDDVVRTCKVFGGADQILPWVGVRDRDLLPDDEVERLESGAPGLFVWPSRMLENELLHPPLLEATLSRAGREVSADRIEEQIRGIAEADKDRLVAELVEQELKKRHDLKPPKADAPLDKLRNHLDGVRASADRQLSELEAVAREVRSELEERWPREWMKLMHGKRVLGEFLSTTPMRSVGDLVAAMAQAIADEPSLMPKGLAALKGRIEELRRE